MRVANDSGRRATFGDAIPGHLVGVVSDNISRCQRRPGNMRPRVTAWERVEQPITALETSQMRRTSRFAQPRSGEGVWSCR
jgi:hypothetical protein